MTRWQRAWKVVGETSREIGILTVVFAPLESAFSEQVFAPALMTAVIIGGLILIGGDILLEIKD